MPRTAWPRGAGFAVALVAALTALSVVFADAPAELTLELVSSREFCTEGTLIEISWSANGGMGPLALRINGKPTSELSGMRRINCGAIPRTDDGGLDQSRIDAVVEGVLTDGSGMTKSTSIRIPRATALPVPTNIDFSAQLSRLSISWDAVAGAGESAPSSTGGRRIGYGLNTRPVETAAWQTEAVAVSLDEQSVRHRILRSRVKEWELSVAAVRHEIELETPAALNWSTPRKFRTTGKPQNLSVDATHDSVTVRFDRQPLSGGGLVEVIGGGGVTSEMYFENGAEGRHEIVIGNLEPGEEYKVTAAIFTHALSAAAFGEGEATASASVRTPAAPAGWAPPAGSLNIRTVATSSSITVHWDPPRRDRVYGWEVTLRLVSDYELLDGHLIDREIIYSKRTAWTTRGSALAGRIQPATTYRVRVAQPGLQGRSAEALVTTPPAGGAAGWRGIPEPGDPQIG